MTTPNNLIPNGNATLIIKYSNEKIPMFEYRMRLDGSDHLMGGINLYVERVDGEKTFYLVKKSLMPTFKDVPLFTRPNLESALSAAYEEAKEFSKILAKDMRFDIVEGRIIDETGFDKVFQQIDNNSEARISLL